MPTLRYTRRHLPSAVPWISVVACVLDVINSVYTSLRHCHLSFLRQDRNNNVQCSVSENHEPTLYISRQMAFVICVEMLLLLTAISGKPFSFSFSDVSMEVKHVLCRLQHRLSVGVMPFWVTYLLLLDLSKRNLKLSSISTKKRAYKALTGPSVEFVCYV